jgi:ABC-2 type transport system permease protein
MPIGRRLVSYGQFMHCQWLNLLRMPAYSIPTLVFPVMFYAFFGILMNPGASAYLLATFATFGVLGAALFAFGVGIATERAQGWYTLIRATPAPLVGIVIGKWFGAALFSAAIIVSMCAIAGFVGGVRLESSQWWGLLAVLILGTLPFCLLGLGLGLLLSPNAAPAVINVVYLPLAFLSGLWVPVSQFPGWLQALAPWLPPYHLAELALQVIGVKTGDPWISLLALVGFSALFSVLVLIGWRRMLAMAK